MEKGQLGGEQGGKVTHEDSSATGLAVLGFVVTRLVSGVSLADLSDSGSFPVAHTSLSQDGVQRGGFWEDIRTRISCRLPTFRPGFSWLVVTC